jgi:hypothetical protein
MAVKGQLHQAGTPGAETFGDAMAEAAAAPA